MSIDEQHHIALPKLYGGPAYARPPMVAETVDRPFDPDELPIEALRTEEEREFVSTLPARAFDPGGASLASDAADGTDEGEPGLRGRPFSLRAVAGRLLGGG